MEHFDVAIVGAGAVGLAIGRQLAVEGVSIRNRVVLLEQEAGFGQHTSSRSSEVIHAGIYYPQDSLKAMLCVRGKELLYDYCRTRHIACARLGKLIIVQPGEEPGLQVLQNQAMANGVDDLEWLDQRQIKKLEPWLTASAGLWSPSSGIFDSHQYMESLLAEAESGGMTWAPHSRVIRVAHGPAGLEIHCEHLPRGLSLNSITTFTINARVLINCAGLAAQSLAGKISGLAPASIPALYPCKGTYYRYRGASPFRHLVYPLPEPGLQGLGIHATVDMAGQCRFGPDTEYVENLDYRVSNWRQQQFTEAIRRYFPGLEYDRLTPDYCGIRPKLAGPGMGFRDFELQDFGTHGVEGLWQLFGIESPGLTASLALAEKVTAGVRLYLGD